MQFNSNTIYIQKKMQISKNNAVLVLSLWRCDKVSQMLLLCKT